MAEDSNYVVIPRSRFSMFRVLFQFSPIEVSGQFHLADWRPVASLQSDHSMKVYTTPKSKKDEHISSHKSLVTLSVSRIQSMPAEEMLHHVYFHKKNIMLTSSAMICHGSPSPI